MTCISFIKSEKGPHMSGFPMGSYFAVQKWKDHVSQPVRIDFNKKFDSKQETIQTFNIDAQGLRKTRNENPPTKVKGVTTYPVPADLPTMGRSAGTG